MASPSGGIKPSEPAARFINALQAVMIIVIPSGTYVICLWL